jgi:hypothetical protein
MLPARTASGLIIVKVYLPDICMFEFGCKDKVYSAYFNVSFRLFI